MSNNNNNNNRIVAAVPNSLLKSRSGSRSKSAKQNPGIDQMSHSKSLAANRAIIGSRGGNSQVITEISEGGHLGNLKLQNNSLSNNMTAGAGKMGGLAMASISSHNLGIRGSNDFNRRISQSPYSIQAKLGNQINVSVAPLLS